MLVNTKYSWMTDEELLTMAAGSDLLTPLELELAARLEETLRFLDEILDKLDAEDEALELALAPVRGIV